MVLLDVGMPGGMDGYEVAQQLRALPILSRVTLVAATGYGREVDVRRAREAGFDHHLLKPFDLGLLEGLLGARRA